MHDRSSSAVIPVEGHPQRKLILGIMCGCLVLIVAAVSSLNVAIPTIVRALDPSSTEQLWILDAYALVFAGLLLLCGALGDRYGRKNALIVGLAIFGVASTVAAYADTPTQLILYRAVMGVGAALIMPATLSTLTVVFAPQDRAKAIAVWAGFAGAGGALGPLLSGLLLERFWWGSVFFIAAPIAAVLLVAIVLVVPNSADPARHRLDYVGSLLSVVALVSIVLRHHRGAGDRLARPGHRGRLRARNGRRCRLRPLGAVTGAPAARPPAVPHPRFGLGSLTVTCSFLVMFGMFYLMTLYMQFVLGYTALESAVRLLPFSVVMIALAPRSPQLTARFGTRQVVAAGFLVQTVGFLLATQLDVGTSYWYLLAVVAPMAAGMALLMPPTTNAIMMSLPQSKAGVASAVNDTTREVGGAIGIALLGSLVTTGYQSSLGDATDGLPPEQAEAARDSIGGAMHVASQLGENGQALVDASRDAFMHGATIAFSVGAAIGLIMTVVIRRLYPADQVEPLPEEEQVRA